MTWKEFKTLIDLRLEEANVDVDTIELIDIDLLSLSKADTIQIELHGELGREDRVSIFNQR